MSRKSNRVPLLFLPRVRACHQAGALRATMLRVPSVAIAAGALETSLRNPAFGTQMAASVRRARLVLQPWIQSMRAERWPLAIQGVDVTSPWWSERLRASAAKRAGAR